ncbi:MAG TPA: bifunctional precorrin-2 dehydrogenase/sirohydrochlorin ferrochelatase [Candidatus Acidoferrales bacterium]|nr:bifunctional precorrin-2 dehydrogenase/sirohydrochlorin ferrochelatase [Candidatus Acidoferrales bacterium]
MLLFPAFLKLASRRCLVVGAGRVAEEKVEGLLHAQADVCVVAPSATRRIRAWARAGKIRWKARTFRSSDLVDAFLIVAASSSPRLHAQIYNQAARRGILCNVVDDPEHCDFYYGAIVRRGSLQIAISTGGLSPALSQRIRKQLEREFGPEYEGWLKEIGNIRQQLLAKPGSVARRKALLHGLASETSLDRFRRKSKGKRSG